MNVDKKKDQLRNFFHLRRAEDEFKHGSRSGTKNKRQTVNGSSRKDRTNVSRGVFDQQPSRGAEGTFIMREHDHDNNNNIGGDNIGGNTKSIVAAPDSPENIVKRFFKKY